MKSLLSALAMAGALASAQAQTAATVDAPSPREWHAAQCVAALEVLTESMALQVKAGKDDVRPQLQSRLEAGTAFVGDSYLNGLTDEHRARALANQALEAQKSLSDSELAARQSACDAEGRKLFDASNPLQQAVVRRLAHRRMEKLLSP